MAGQTDGQDRTGGGACRVLHISADFPDPLQPAKTRAISNLIDLTHDTLDHHVYSLNRIGPRHTLAALPFGPDWRAVAYPGPPRGLFLKTYLDRVADWIRDDVRARGLRVDLVHAHKLSTDGLVGARLATALGVPLMVSSQGISDEKILRARPDLRRVWRAIWREAAVMLPFAPWTTTLLTELLGPRAGPTVVLPCPNEQDTVVAPRPADPVVKTCFHLREHARKNVLGLIQAVAVAARTVPDLRLEILGGGDPAGCAAVQAAIRTHAPDRCRLVGPVPRERIQAEMNAACAFVLVPFRESFGMVYTEALLSGAPVVHANTNGIAGYFPDTEAVVGVPPGDTDGLAAVLVDRVRRQDTIKAALRTLQDAGGLDPLRRAGIRATYLAAVETARGRHRTGPGGSRPERSNTAA
ncbi:glycosyltransferase family 4 protein [Roseospira marina]|uniref:Glycosyltransferase family 4 protein n=1 Tax=Roseospira marina TaxID=140057 RepID=A0A5M6I908_9PROT|nr:glycosyltransferase [Roseospira marina]KAA5604673.1 glycosyltransferase family 4 protein [Roseospira marina]MBB4315119.1 glycosyltransferase involved in cell wall biosynthesis [Roseospira marina]MBB5088111.1 glycosyltransferase involved in cell wall biosynthesis [Roseospira marina]